LQPLLPPPLLQNRLKEIPDNISVLTNLKRLVASHNEITLPPPPGLCLCKQLHELDLGHNSISTLPPDLKSLTKLRILLLPHNHLTIFPKEIYDMRIDQLDISDNPLEEGGGLKKIPDRFLIMNEQYQLARSKDRRQKMIGRAMHMREKLVEAHKRCLINNTTSFAT